MILLAIHPSLLPSAHPTFSRGSHIAFCSGRWQSGAPNPPQPTPRSWVPVTEGKTVNPLYNAADKSLSQGCAMGKENHTVAYGGCGIIRWSEIFTWGISVEELICGLLGGIPLVWQVVKQQEMIKSAVTLFISKQFGQLHLPPMEKDITGSLCYCTLEVESSRLAVEALDLSNSIKAFSQH